MLIITQSKQCMAELKCIHSLKQKLFCEKQACWMTGIKQKHYDDRNNDFLEKDT